MATVTHTQTEVYIQGRWTQTAKRVDCPNCRGFFYVPLPGKKPKEEFRVLDLDSHGSPRNGCQSRWAVIATYLGNFAPKGYQPAHKWSLDWTLVE